MVANPSLKSFSDLLYSSSVMDLYETPPVTRIQIKMINCALLFSVTELILMIG